MKPLLLETVKVAKDAITLKRDLVSSSIRKEVARRVHLSQYEATEKDLAGLIEEQINLQVADAIKQLEGLAETKAVSDIASVFAAQIDTKEWKRQLIDAVLPMMAIKMAEAAVAQMVMFGVNPRSKGARVLFEKHLGNQHNQSSHGRGLAGTKRTADGKLTMEDGSALPDHIPKNIPPAWTSVEVAIHPEAELLVKGRDAKGRRQSVYSDAHWVKAAEKKFARINELRTKEKSIRSALEKDMKSTDVVKRDSAACLRMIQQTGLRPGSNTDTRAKVQAYGATTLEGRHVQVVGKYTYLNFTGKKGVALKIPVKDEVVKQDLLARKAKAGKSGKLYPNTDSVALLGYSKTQDGGGFKVKDFRTAKGTSVAVATMKKMKPPKDQKSYKKAVKAVASKVATQLGNTPTVALQSYIDPGVFSEWRIK